MCRLALMNKAGADFIEKTYGLTAFLTYLETRMGGHGNGYALVKDGKCVDLRKGVNLTNKTIAKAVKKTDFDWFIYHTRLASCGTIADRNCHPFQHPLTGDILAANGTERDIVLYNRDNHIDRTDTETLLLDFLRDDEFFADTGICWSTLVGIHKGKAFARKNLGSLYKLALTPNIIALASEFPTRLQSLAYPCNGYYEPGFEFSKDTNSKYKAAN